MSLISLADAKVYPNLSGLTDALLQVYLDNATGIIEAYCNRSFALLERTEIRDGNGSINMDLQNLPMTALAEVVITDSDDTDYTLAADVFKLNLAESFIQFNPNTASTFSFFPTGFQNISVKYTSGYSPIPDAVQAACALVAGVLNNLSGSGTDNTKKSEKIGDYSYTNFTTAEMSAAGNSALSPTVKLMLYPYVKKGAF